MHIAGIATLLTLLQAPLAVTETQGKWLVAFTVVLTIAVLIQTAVLAAMGFVVIKLLAKVNEITAKLETKIWPLVDTARDVVNDTVPKVKRVTTNIADTSDVYRAKLAEIDTLITETSKVYRAKVAEADSFLNDAAAKAKRQSDRVDGIVSEALTSAESAASKVERTVTSPFRHGAAVIAGVKASAEKLVENFSKKPASQQPKPVAFEGDTVYTGLEDDYHA